VYWQDDAMWLGYLEEYPDYMTQGKSLEELMENLKDCRTGNSMKRKELVRQLKEAGCSHTRQERRHDWYQNP
jgi:hypothetical protein